MRDGVSVLFCIGGDGTLRGASAIAAEAVRRGLRLAVVGVPKTIDNDLDWVERSFGFATAVEAAARTILAAHAEARGALHGIGLVKLMGRHAGFIAANATLARPDVNLCLVPEVPFTLEGDGGVLDVLADRLSRRRHAVVVVAEGAGQELLPPVAGADASGNARLADIGWLRDQLRRRARRLRPPAGGQVPRPQLRDPRPAGERLRRRLLPVARPDGRARRDGRQDRRSCRLPPQPLHPRADQTGGHAAPAAGSRRGHVATGPAVDRPTSRPRRALTFGHGHFHLSIPRGDNSVQAVQTGAKGPVATWPSTLAAISRAAFDERVASVQLPVGRERSCDS